MLEETSPVLSFSGTVVEANMADLQTMRANILSVKT
jgi:hypothetical protein